MTDRKIDSTPGLELYSHSNGPGEVARADRAIPGKCPVLVCPSAAPWQATRLFVIHDGSDPCQHPRPLRVRTDSWGPSGEILHVYGPLVLYRTAESVRGLAEWFAESGQALRSLLWYERAVLLRADVTDLGVDGDAGWAKYEKLKALALAPGTAGEGDAALKAALQVIRRLAGGEA